MRYMKILTLLLLILLPSACSEDHDTTTPGEAADAICSASARLVCNDEIAGYRDMRWNFYDVCYGVTVLVEPELTEFLVATRLTDKELARRCPALAAAL